MTELYVSRALLDKAGAVTDRVSESDRAYFQRNPTHTLVVRITGRVRARTFYHGDVFEGVNKPAAHAWLAARARDVLETLKAGRLQPVEPTVT